MGGVLTIVGFSAFGKHAGNIVPIMAGVVLGSFVMHSSVSSGAVQLAMLFGTTLAPISGYFGWPYGVLAGVPPLGGSTVCGHAGGRAEPL